MANLYESDCVNVYNSGTGDGYSTAADACSNCQTSGQYIAQNYMLGGTCQPFVDSTSSAVSQVNDGTYGFISDGTNWYYEQPQIGNDHAYAQNACKAPFNPYVNQNFQAVGTCPAEQSTEGFELFGLGRDKSMAIAVVLFILLVVLGAVIYKRKLFA